MPEILEYDEYGICEELKDQRIKNRRSVYFKVYKEEVFYSGVCCALFAEVSPPFASITNDIYQRFFLPLVTLQRKEKAQRMFGCIG